MFNQPSVTKAALLGALHRRLVGSLLPQKKHYNFPALPYPIGQSLLYPLVLTVAPGQFVFLHKFAELFAFLGLWHSDIKRFLISPLNFNVKAFEHRRLW